jgi:hypothetical protein
MRARKSAANSAPHPLQPAADRPEPEADPLQPTADPESLAYPESTKPEKTTSETTTGVAQPPHMEKT